MNKNAVLKLLESILGQFRCHSALLAELAALVAKSGFEAAFFSLLVARLHMLTSAGRDAIVYREFERLKHTDCELYSMHLAGSGFNIRVLYSFLPDHRPIMLLAFFERSGKRNSDYSAYLPAAAARLAEERRAYENESFQI